MIHFSRKGIQTQRTSIRVNGRRVSLLILRPEENDSAAGRDDAATNAAFGDATATAAPGVLWSHGGGYATGMKEMVYMGRAVDLVRNHGAVVVSPGYHLSLLHPYPVALWECYAALIYMKDHAAELGICSDQIMIGGESAGGGLTAAVAMLARDKGEVRIAYQMPLYPMIDNFDTNSSRDNHAKAWNTRRNHMAWKLYLRKDYNKEVAPYAAPARAKDYCGLPPAYTFVCTAEPFYDETLQFVRNLQAAGVEAKADVYEGMYHAFDMMEPEHPTSRAAIQAFNEAFAYAKEHYFAKNT